MPDTCFNKVPPSAVGQQFTVTDMDGNLMGCNNQSTVSWHVGERKMLLCD